VTHRDNYDPTVLDWVFWWYLGTVELTNRIISRLTRQASRHRANQKLARADMFNCTAFQLNGATANGGCDLVEALADRRPVCSTARRFS
jgi:hypothetical protein